MRRVLLLGWLVLATAIIGLWWMFKHLPWWASLAVILALAVAAKLLAGRVFTWALSIPFKWKGTVLKGATIQVHFVVPARGPVLPLGKAGGSAGQGMGDFENEAAGADKPPKARVFYELDVTITPLPTTGKFHHWGPGELVLVKPESKLRLYGADDQDDSCEIRRVNVEEEGQFKEDDGFTYLGPQHLKLLLAVESGVRQLKFRYYFEEFGDIQLPPADATAQQSSAQQAA